MNAVKKYESPHVKKKANSSTSATTITQESGGIDSKQTQGIDESSKQLQPTSSSSLNGSDKGTGTKASPASIVESSLKQSSNGSSSHQPTSSASSASTSKKDSKSPTALEAANNKPNASSTAIEYTNPSTASEAANKCDWDGKYIANHTLVGGINSGDFREHTKASTIEKCMANCCKEDDCDLSFMIDTDCYTVKCFRSDLCQTRKAKTTSFVPKIAYKRRPNVVVVDERK